MVVRREEHGGTGQIRLRALRVESKRLVTVLPGVADVALYQQTSGPSRVRQSEVRPKFDCFVQIGQRLRQATVPEMSPTTVGECLAGTGRALDCGVGSDEVVLDYLLVGTRRRLLLFGGRAGICTGASSAPDSEQPEKDRGERTGGYPVR